MNSKTALIIGATGATGSALVSQLIKDDAYAEIHVFVRNKPNLEHPKLKVHVVDFNNTDVWKDKIKGDVLFSAMGTTLKTAGSKEAQYKIDYTYQHEVAKAAAQNGVAKLMLVSSVGSKSTSLFFYPKIKGQLEDAVAELSFKEVHVFQPPMLERGVFLRSNEKFGIKLLNFLNKFGVLKSQRPMPVDFLATQMIKVTAQNNSQKVNKYSPKTIWNI
tara:strand:+ start:32 stop:682 length:651 start_codon:yes stop_codon:yes gene_type:complete